MNNLGFSQNILEALQLKQDLIGEYLEGELVSTDTIIDLRNGYYEEFKSEKGGNKTIIRQAALFHNHDGSKTLGISKTAYDFVCFYNETNFYEIIKSKDSIFAVFNDDVLPDLSIREFIIDSNIISVLNKYLPEIQGSYLDLNATVDGLLSEFYQIIYILPQRGTSLVSTLRICDYIPTNIVTMTSDDLSIIENCFVSIEMKYDRILKKFVKVSSEK